MRRDRLAPALGLGILLSTATPAFAQRTDDNAVADADDAFGRSIGGEQVGIYSPDNVRNFSPIAAGNVRIEGLYFDQQAFVTDRAVRSRTVHVGISAQGYPFPAPTGIADYELRKPGAKALASVALTVGPYGGYVGEIDAQLPLIGDTLGLTAGHAYNRSRFDTGTTVNTEGYGASLLFRPNDRLSLQPFFALVSAGDEERTALIFTSGDFLPPEIDRPDFYGQRWADFNAKLINFGSVARARLGSIDLRAGLFRSALATATSFADLHLGTDRDGAVAQRLMVAERDNYAGSTSGELRATRVFADGPRRHLAHASLRGRRLGRRYGGAALIDLGPSRIGVEDFRPEPSLTFGQKTLDAVRQVTGGLGYEMRWRNVGEFSLGIQKTDYSKQVTTPATVLPETTDSPWLWSATAAAYLSSRVALYAGYTRGLEESDVAPQNAVNRNEAPPALRTRQMDAGVRIGLTDALSLVAGLFDVEKPYFNLDSTNRFRELGMVRNRGGELSLAGRIAPGLTINAGATYLDAKVSGEPVQLGLIGPRPIGNFRLRTLANFNWQLPWHPPLTLTTRFEYVSSRVANSANTLEIPGRSITSLGARYRMTMGKVPVLVRGSIDNVFDKFGWSVGGSGFFVPNGPRRFSLTVAADF